MFNPLNLITKFIKSSNQKELDRIGKIVKTINSLEDEFKKLDDLDFPKKTQEYKEQIKQGKTLDELLPASICIGKRGFKKNSK
jgi:preprotein translocase subunit SecA